jgi:protein SCO1/2/putative membrane protein
MRVVSCTILAAALVSLVITRTAPPPAPAAQDLGEAAESLGKFQLVERSGQITTEADLAGKVAIVSFIFTRCPLSCPRISTVMKSLQDRLENTRVLLVSLSVDPDHDTPAVLDAYGKRFGARPDRWWFLTGSRPLIYELIERGFKLSVMANPASGADGNGEAISHSDRLALVDRGRVAGLFDSKDPAALDALVASARRLALPGWVKALPRVNASLNALCAALLLMGWTLIRARDRFSPGLTSPAARGHAACMSLAVFTSAVFLGCYLVYHCHALSVPFQGRGPVRLVYFTILLSHTILATFGVLPLVCVTLFRAMRGDYARHSSIAALTFPIWLYVSVTGVVIYLMLYQMPVASGTTLPV